MRTLRLWAAVMTLAAFLLPGLAILATPRASPPLCRAQANVSRTETTGTAPVFAVTTVASAGGNSALVLSVVRESDVLSPSTTGSASAITEGAVGAQTFPDGAYWLVRPANIATNRFVYLEEMDLIQYAHANAFVAGATLPVTLYGEGTARTYQAGAVRTGTLRPLILVAGGGV